MRGRATRRVLWATQPSRRLRANLSSGRASRVHLPPQEGKGRYCANVLQDEIWPLLRPAVSHLARIAEEPWVKLSGTA